MSRQEDEEARVTREVAARAIRRLDLLEWALFAGAAALALVGGALVAWLVSSSSPRVGFRSTWIVASAFFFVVPGAIALTHARREERRRAHRIQTRREQREEPRDE